MLNLLRFDGHGNSKKERGPDGSKKERAPGVYGAIQKPGSGDGDPQRQSVVQIARELGCSEASLHGWKKAYLKGQQPGQIDGQQQSPEQMAQTIRQLHKEVEYLKRQREILKKAMSIVGEEPNPGMR